MYKSIVLGSIAALGLGAQAFAADEAFSYSYLEANYLHTDLAHTDINGNGFGVNTAWSHRVPRSLAVTQLSYVAFGPGNRAGDQLLARLRLADDDHMIALAVAAAGGESRIVEDPFEDFIGQRVAGVFADRTRGAHDVV